jgi:O-antigen/teichoic acid export membrane protein
MSNIRRQSIISSLVIYFGFAIGLLNTYFFTRQGNFTVDQYGLTTVSLAIAIMMSSFSMLAMPSYIFKFYHHYNDYVPPKKNDMLTWALLISTVGFILVMLTGWGLKDLVVKKYGTNAPLLVQYYYWVFPLGFGLTIYTVLEAFAWNAGKSVLTNYFREVQWRLFITVLIVLMLVGVIKDFNVFIQLYSFSYLSIAISLFVYLYVKGHIHLNLKPSKVSRRLLKQIGTYCAFVFGSSFIFNISQVFDSFVLASLKGLDIAGIFGFATIITSLIQAPQRGIIAAAVTHLSKAWKDKNIPLLQRIYQRSSINLLIFACCIFLLIWLNYADAVTTFKLDPKYQSGAWVFFLLGITRIIDMGTGVNQHMLITSNFWRFELLSGVVLLALMLPLTYFLAKEIGLLGPAIATLISVTIYNIIRIIFLWKKHGLQPFSIKTAYTLLLAAGCYAICYLAFKNLEGFAGMFARSIVFLALYVTGTIYLRLSPDLEPVLQTIKKRLRVGK